MQKKRVFSAQHRKKISLSRIGKKAWNKGIPCSEETKKKISLANTGNRLTEKQKKELSIAQRNGKTGKYKRTKKHLKNMSLSIKEWHKHNINPFKNKKHTEQTKKKISEKNSGKIISPETREKMSLAHLGSKSPRWKGGITKLQRLIRGLYKYRKWRNTILKRDDYKCVICGNVNNLEVDHYPHQFRDILVKSNIKSTEESVRCDELWDTNNGRTVCNNCHKQTRRNAYGTKYSV